MASKTINTILNLKDNFSKTVKKTTDNTKKFQRQIKQAENQAKKMRESVSKGFKIISAGAVAAGVGMFALVNKTAEAMDEVDKMSERTGLTRERLQELKYAAAQCDVEFTTLENGVKMLTKNMGKADEESKRMVDAFEKMGIEIKDGNGNIKSSTELFEESIKKLADMEDQTERNIVGQKIFGNSYQDMIPLLNQGSKGIKELTDRSRELGLVIDEEAVKANVVFGDTLTDVKLSVGALGMRLSNVLLPYFQRFADYALTVIPKIEPTIKKVFGKMAEAINRIRENMNWLLPVAAGLLGTFMAFQIITTITAAIRAYTTFTKGLTLAQALLNKTMLGNPMVWMAIGIGVLIAAGVALWKNWDTVKEKLSGAWEGIKKAFSGLVNLIISGLNKMMEFALAPLNLIIKGANLIPGVNIPELTLNIPKIPEFALGTQYFKGGLARINERGGEVVNLPGGSQVIPADKSKNISKGHTFNFYFNGNVGTEEFFNRAGEFIVKKVVVALNNM